LATNSRRRRRRRFVIARIGFTQLGEDFSYVDVFFCFCRDRPVPVIYHFILVEGIHFQQG
jgi:hypothetical protein